jgi:hypothetical protein
LVVIDAEATLAQAAVVTKIVTSSNFGHVS